MTSPDPGNGAPAVNRLSFAVDQGEPMSALLMVPSATRALFVYGHGAGAPMEHPFMGASARELAARDVATFRYNFPYMQRRTGRPDPAAVLFRTVRRAVECAAEALPGTPLFAGGKSMGGRMTSQAQAEAPLPAVRGLVFVGFPLHRPKQANVERAAHLDRVEIPLLFLQGTRDEMADLELIRDVTEKLGSRATLHVVEGADHSFHVLKRSGSSDAQVLAEIADRMASWMKGVAG